MTRGSPKGSAWERDLCRQFSEWWTDGRRDDVFWRTSISGGRATVRRKKGKRTAFQYGDMMASDPIGQPLISLATFEFKRGYSKNTVQDLLDRQDDGALQMYEKWIDKAITDYKAAGSLGWIMVVKRDRRKPLVLLSSTVYKFLIGVVGVLPAWPSSLMKVAVRRRKRIHTCLVFAASLDDFFAEISPKDFAKLL